MDQIKAGAFLKDLRKDKEITQEQLAEELGVSGRTIFRWETGIYDRNDFFRYAYGISEALIYVTVLMFPLYTTGLLVKSTARIQVSSGQREFFLRVRGTCQKTG